MSITVIIPTYNRDAFLEDAVLSVAGQTLACDELIIIDDGSIDNTRRIIENMARRLPFPLRYYCQENKGAAAARNAGIGKASSEYLCFLDSDDRFAPEKLQLQYHAMLQSGSLISHTRETWFRRGILLNQKKRHRPREGFIFDDCLTMCVVGMSTVMAGKEIFDKYGGFNERLPCCEDYDFWLRVSVRENFQLIDRPLTIKHGGRADQLSVIHRQGMDRYRIMAIVNLLDRNRLTDRQRQLAIEELHRKCMIYGRGCCRHGREAEGRFYLGLPGKYREKCSWAMAE
ncbi:MAG: glycosyltransferase family A protein [Desulfobulbaceae bacterium]|nr:glycosyltransferase family A protein [Desulfobulbaceae bacterium]